MRRALLFAFAALALSACNDRQSFREIEPGWERMMTQERVDPYAASDFFEDGKAMRQPPRGTVPWKKTGKGPRAERGTTADGVWVDRVPLPVTRASLATGRLRFETYCAACHGVLGDGDTPVADAMKLRRPPSLHEERIRAFPVGRIYQTITEGYGLMPSYRAELSTEERWAVVEYVQALQLSQHAAKDVLAPDDLRALEREAP